MAIWVAILLVTGVGAANDYAKDQQFRKLNAQKEAIQIKLIRNGERVVVLNHDIVVGDLIILDGGDKVIADCLLIKHQGIVIDEASLTGESEPIKKTVEGDPWIRSGTMVSLTHLPYEPKKFSIALISPIRLHASSDCISDLDSTLLGP